jgi:AcrR family transcriptional regulator
MASQKNLSTRRVPKQERSERRVEIMLAAAGAVIGQRGLEAATMTDIAAQAGMSIGALYQYFPNKDALATALRASYAEEMDQRWSALVKVAGASPLSGLAAHLIQLLTDFVEDHPAYLFLFEASVKSDRSEKARQELRRRFADLFMSRSANLSQTDAMRVAEVALMIVKGWTGLYASRPSVERKGMQAEVATALTAYLRERLKGA